MRNLSVWTCSRCSSRPRCSVGREYLALVCIELQLPVKTNDDIIYVKSTQQSAMQ